MAHAETHPVTTLPSREEATPSPTPTSTLGASGPSWVADCLHTQHPVLRGRIRVAWETPEGAVERWVPTLQGLPVREGDRVLLVAPGNSREPVVVGVVDGFARRPEVSKRRAAQLDLKPDEAVCIAGAEGQPLVEIHQGESGPVVKLLDEDLDVELPGRLRFKAKRIELEAEGGAVDVRATDDVTVRGEIIHLNP